MLRSDLWFGTGLFCENYVPNENESTRDVGEMTCGEMTCGEMNVIHLHDCAKLTFTAYFFKHLPYAMLHMTKSSNFDKTFDYSYY